MLQRIPDFQLLKYNTFAVPALCREAFIINSVQDLAELPTDRQYLVLGGGSNILCNDYIESSLLKIEIPGIRVVQEEEDFIELEVGGGVNWDDFVSYTVDQGYGGLENLTLIPGTVGAAPVQNIGAYGVEQDQLMVQLRAYDLKDRKPVVIDKRDCAFAYRDSRFKSREKGRFVITYVTYRLTKKGHQINTSYGAIKRHLEEQGADQPTIRAVRQAVAAIRRAKLPAPSQLPNAGSFFKNPILYSTQFTALLAERPDLIYYPLDDGTYKVPAGWLIDQCGYRGFRKGNVGCYKHQALVVVNYGGATGREVSAFSREVQQAVLDKFAIHLVPEVNHWGF